MKIGLVVECSEKGADEIICRHLCTLLAPHVVGGIELLFDNRDHKLDLIANAANSCQRLFDEGCQRVIVLWDESPAQGFVGKLCWSAERSAILQNLHTANLQHHDIVLVCVEKEIEAWLLADLNAVASALTTEGHKVERVPGSRAPERIRDPKAKLRRLFKDLKHWTYDEVKSASRIVSNITDLNKLKRCPTFVRFASKVTGRTPEALGLE